MKPHLPILLHFFFLFFSNTCLNIFSPHPIHTTMLPHDHQINNLPTIFPTAYQWIVDTPSLKHTSSSPVFDMNNRSWSLHFTNMNNIAFFSIQYHGSSYVDIVSHIHLTINNQSKDIFYTFNKFDNVFTFPLSEIVSTLYTIIVSINTHPHPYLSKSITGYSGLRNLGATCYMNSYLQVLFNLNLFVNRMFELKSMRKTFQVQKLFYHMLKSDDTVDTKVFVDSCRFFDDAYTHQDVHEFSKIILDCIENENKDINSSVIGDSKGSISKDINNSNSKDINDSKDSKSSISKDINGSVSNSKDINDSKNSTSKDSKDVNDSKNSISKDINGTKDSNVTNISKDNSVYKSVNDTKLGDDAKIVDDTKSINSKGKIDKDKFFLDDLFKGKFTHFIDCKCGCKRIVEEDFYEIQLEIKDWTGKRVSNNLKEGLKILTSNVEHLNKSNQYRCDKHGLVDAVKGMKIKETPPVLNILLKRFMMGLDGEGKKINDEYVFENEIEIEVEGDGSKDRDEGYVSGGDTEYESDGSIKSSEGIISSDITNTKYIYSVNDSDISNDSNDNISKDNNSKDNKSLDIGKDNSGNKSNDSKDNKSVDIGNITNSNIGNDNNSKGNGDIGNITNSNIGNDNNSKGNGDIGNITNSNIGNDNNSKGNGDIGNVNNSNIGKDNNSKGGGNMNIGDINNSNIGRDNQSMDIGNINNSKDNKSMDIGNINIVKDNSGNKSNDSTSTGRDNTSTNTRKIKYELYAVIVHSGISSDGHYYSFINKNGWYKFNDTIVSKACTEEVFYDNFGGYNPVLAKEKNHSGYLLIYIQKELKNEIVDQEIKISKELEHLLNRESREIECRVVQFDNIQRYRGIGYPRDDSDRGRGIGERYHRIVKANSEDTLYRFRRGSFKNNIYVYDNDFNFIHNDNLIKEYKREDGNNIEYDLRDERGIAKKDDENLNEKNYIEKKDDNLRDVTGISKKDDDYLNDESINRKKNENLMDESVIAKKEDDNLNYESIIRKKNDNLRNERRTPKKEDDDFIEKGIIGKKNDNLRDERRTSKKDDDDFIEKGIIGKKNENLRNESVISRKADEGIIGKKNENLNDDNVLNDSKIRKKDENLGDGSMNHERLMKEDKLSLENSQIDSIREGLYFIFETNQRKKKNDILIFLKRYYKEENECVTDKNIRLMMKHCCLIDSQMKDKEGLSKIINEKISINGNESILYIEEIEERKEYKSNNEINNHMIKYTNHENNIEEEILDKKNTLEDNIENRQDVKYMGRLVYKIRKYDIEKTLNENGLREGSIIIGMKKEDEESFLKEYEIETQRRTIRINTPLGMVEIRVKIEDGIEEVEERIKELFVNDKIGIKDKEILIKNFKPMSLNKTGGNNNDMENKLKSNDKVKCGSGNVRGNINQTKESENNDKYNRKNDFKVGKIEYSDVRNTENNDNITKFTEKFNINMHDNIKSENNDTVKGEYIYCPDIITLDLKDQKILDIGIEIGKKTSNKDGVTHRHPICVDSFKAKNILKRLSNNECIKKEIENLERKKEETLDEEKSKEKKEGRFYKIFKTHLEKNKKEDEEEKIQKDNTEAIDRGKENTGFISKILNRKYSYGKLPVPVDENERKLKDMESQTYKNKKFEGMTKYYYDILKRKYRILEVRKNCLTIKQYNNDKKNIEDNTTEMALDMGKVSGNPNCIYIVKEKVKEKEVGIIYGEIDDNGMIKLKGYPFLVSIENCKTIGDLKRKYSISKDITIYNENQMLGNGDDDIIDMLTDKDVLILH